MDDRPTSPAALNTTHADDADREDSRLEFRQRALEAEQRLQDITRLVSDWIWETDVDLRLTHSSGRIFDIIGKPAQSVLGTPLTKLGNFLDRHSADTALKSRQPFRDITVLLADLQGVERRLLLSGIPIFGRQGGKFLGYRGTAEDITEKYTSEEALRASEERYRTLVELAPAAIFVVRDFVILYANSTAAELIGVKSAEALVGYPYLDFIHPDDQPLVRARRGDIEHRQMNLSSHEIRHVKLNGEMFYGVDAATPVVWQGQEAALVSVRDIDAIKRSELALTASEQRFRDFAESTADRFWETDADHKVVFFSYPDRLESLLPEGDILGRYRWDLPGFTAADSELEHVEAAMEAREPFRDFRYSVSGRDQRIFHLRSNGRPILSAEGEFQGYRGTTIDETAEREAEAKVHDIQRQFSEALESISEGAALWGPDGEFIYCNSSYREKHPYASAELAPGQSYESFLRRLATDGGIAAIESMGGEEWVQSRLEQMGQSGRRIEGIVGGRWVEMRDEILPDGSMVVLYNDITEAKEREAALAESEQRFKSFAETAANRMWETDENHRFSMAATGDQDYLTAKGEMLGQTRWERPGADPDEELWRRHREDLDAHKPFRDFQFRQIDSSGKTRYLRANGTPLFGEDGSFKGYRGTAVDVTAEVLAERALRESETRLRQITDAIPAFIAYHDHETRFIFANKYFEKIGVNADDAIGKTIEEVFGPDTQARIAPHLDKVLTGESVEYENYFSSPEGEPIITQVNINPEIGLNGKVEGFFVLSVDITERKKWEEELARNKESLDAAQRTARIGSWERRAADNHLIWSEELYRIYGLEPEQGGITYEKFISYLHPEDRQRLTEIMEESARLRRPGWSSDYRIVRPDGTERFIHGEGKITYDSDRNPLIISGTAQDISERQRAEEALEATRREAELANRAKSEFLSSMSHELRTPMNAILGYAQLLLQNQKQPLSDLQARQVNQILRGGQHLLQLINDILDLAKIESGHLALTMESVDPRRIVDECIELVRSLADRREIEIEDKTISHNLPAIRSDPTRFKQALLNLMSNAIKYNRQSGQVIIKAFETDKGMLQVSVEDTGLGIPADRQRELFEPFSRLGAEERGIEGTGIGLIITKQLVELMDGQINYESEEGVGSRFWIELPVADAEAEVAADRSISVTSMPEHHAHIVEAPRSLLYVEDDVSNLQLMEEVVAQLPNVELLSAPTAEAGIEIARAKQLDLVILDVNLPGMSGLEALTEIRRIPHLAGVPIIALSAAARMEDIRRGQMAGFDRYLTKPIKVDDVLRVLNRLLYDPFEDA